MSIHVSVLHLSKLNFKSAHTGMNIKLNNTLLIHYTAKKVITLMVCNCLNCKIGGHKVGFSTKMQGKHIQRFGRLFEMERKSPVQCMADTDLFRKLQSILGQPRFLLLHGLKSFAVDECCTSNCLVCELLQRTHFK